jgi:hypothetical protein
MVIMVAVCDTMDQDKRIALRKYKNNHVKFEGKVVATLHKNTLVWVMC